MNPIHALNNWEQMMLRGYGFAVSALVFRGAPINQEGEMYPPVEWELITAAAGAVKMKLPQVWTKHEDDHKRVVGAVWEIAARYEDGEYDDLEEEQLHPVRELICALHKHLGDFYAEFVAWTPIKS